MKWILATLICLSLSGCGFSDGGEVRNRTYSKKSKNLKGNEYTSPMRSKALKTLSNAGYTSPIILESHWIAPDWYGCSKEDDVAYDCEATNSNGHRVQVTVCSNLFFKRSTIRH